MKLFTTVSRSRINRTFGQRLRSTALWWGVPMLILELVGIPWRMWIYILLLAFPATAIAVVAGAALEHLALSRKPQEFSQK